MAIHTYIPCCAQCLPMSSLCLCSHNRRMFTIQTPHLYLAPQECLLPTMNSGPVVHSLSHSHYPDGGHVAILSRFRKLSNNTTNWLGHAQLVDKHLRLASLCRPPFTFTRPLSIWYLTQQLNENVNTNGAFFITHVSPPIPINRNNCQLLYESNNRWGSKTILSGTREVRWPRRCNIVWRCHGQGAWDPAESCTKQPYFLALYLRLVLQCTQKVI